MMYCDKCQVNIEHNIYMGMDHVFCSNNCRSKYIDIYFDVEKGYDYVEEGLNMEHSYDLNNNNVFNICKDYNVNFNNFIKNIFT